MFNECHTIFPSRDSVTRFLALNLNYLGPCTVLLKVQYLIVPWQYAIIHVAAPRNSSSISLIQQHILPRHDQVWSAWLFKGWYKFCSVTEMLNSIIEEIRNATTEKITVALGKSIGESPFYEALFFWIHNKYYPIWFFMRRFLRMRNRICEWGWWKNGDHNLRTLYL